MGKESTDVNLWQDLSFHAWPSGKGRRHSAGSDVVQTNQETEWELPFLHMMFWPCF